MSTGSLSEGTVQYFNAKNIQFILDEAMHSLVQAMPDDPLAFLEEALRTPTPVRIVLLGPPGSGKSTLAAKLAERFGVVHIEASPTASSGDFAAATDVIPRITALHQSGQGWVLDGFPETRADTIQLQTCGVTPQKVFELQAPVDVTMARIKATQANDAAVSEDDVLRRYRYYDMRRSEVAAAYRSAYMQLPATGSAEEVMEHVAHEIDALHLS